MQQSVVERFRRALSARKEGVAAWFSSGSEDRELCLGGCSPDEVRVIDELEAAIKCTETGEFGRCDWCDGEVEVELLRADFTTHICLSCYSEGELRTLERDMELAASVQQQLFPRFVPALSGVEIAAHVRPARFVGGDYYDFFPYSDHTQGAVVADVMGKGLAASMLMSNLQASIRILGPSYDDPAALMVRLNELFRYNVSMTKFISIFLIKVDPDKSCLRYVSAGHNPAVHWRAEDGRVRLMGPTGPAVGLIHEPVYESRVVPFAPGDSLVVYTDGVSETRDGRGEEFGLQGIEQAVVENSARSAVEMVEGVRKSLDAFAESAPLDDTTLLVVRRSPVHRDLQLDGSDGRSGGKPQESLVDGGMAS